MAWLISLEHAATRPDAFDGVSGGGEAALSACARHLLQLGRAGLDRPGAARGLNVQWARMLRRDALA
ncbi:hypothetical protein [Nonomuraea sp. NPDC050202]|uniref:hypothetical protein n=1 Tax=Nonomuraea sp. NPDC050202 TaxID=3155035 RepID=UPI0034064217